MELGILFGECHISYLRAYISFWFNIIRQQMMDCEDWLQPSQVGKIILTSVRALFVQCTCNTGEQSVLSKHVTITVSGGCVCIQHKI